MAIQAFQLDRVFVWSKSGTDIKLDDPSAGMNPEEVLGFYANLYPELTSAAVEAPVQEGDKLVYKFKASVGTKG